MKNTLFCLLTAGVLLFVNGCSMQQEKPKKIRDLEFTVVAENNLPEELQNMIEEKKEQPFKITYTDNGWLYVAEGYGAQNVGGYSIQVKDFFEGEG